MRQGSVGLGRSIVVLGAVLLLFACETPRVESDYDRSVAFTGFHTFALLHREHVGISNPLAVTHAEDDIKQELQRRGFVEATDPASSDMVVDFTLGAQERLDINSYPSAYAGPWLWGGPHWDSNLSVRQYREGSLAIDIFDSRSRRPVWHGSIKKELTRSDIEQPGEAISSAVNSVLSKFPPA
jgi:hypothetical protein